MSNDVRRFDDSGVFWVFLWAGPLELAIVLALLVQLLGPAAALAGVASLLLVMPVQVDARAGRGVRSALVVSGRRRLAAARHARAGRGGGVRQSGWKYLAGVASLLRASCAGGSTRMCMALLCGAADPSDGFWHLQMFTLARCMAWPPMSLSHQAG